MGRRGNLILILIGLIELPTVTMLPRNDMVIFIKASIFTQQSLWCVGPF